MNELMLGLYVTVVGVTIVFTVLSILAVTVYLLKYIGKQKTKQPVEEKETMEASGKTGEITRGGISIEKIQPPVDPETLSAITAGIIGFQEAKKKRLMRINLFREYPTLARLLPLAGIHYKAEVEVSVQGSPKKIIVEELGIGYYKVVIGNREYTVVVRK